LFFFSFLFRRAGFFSLQGGRWGFFFSEGRAKKIVFGLYKKRLEEVVMRGRGRRRRRSLSILIARDLPPRR
jgi:hypothetical protein